MAKVIDITPKLTNEAPVVKLWGKEYTADTRKNTVLELYQMMDKSSGTPDDMCKGIEMILGKDAIKAIDTENLYFADLKTVFYGALAAATDEPLDDIINRFRGKEPENE